MRKEPTESFIEAKLTELRQSVENLKFIRDVFIFLYFFAIVGAILVIKIILIHKSVLSYMGAGVLVLDIIGGILAIRELNKYIKRELRSFNRIRRAFDAEYEVQKYLLNNLTPDYTVLSNIPTYKGDADIVVIGPSGVFMIEVKSHYGELYIDNRNHLRLKNGERIYKDYREQIFQTLIKLRKMIENGTGLKVWITPLIVFPYATLTKKLVWVSSEDNFKIIICSKNELLREIYSSEHKLTSSEIKRIANTLIKKDL